VLSLPLGHSQKGTNGCHPSQRTIWTRLTVPLGKGLEVFDAELAGACEALEMATLEVDRPENFSYDREAGQALAICARKAGAGKSEPMGPDSASKRTRPQKELPRRAQEMHNARYRWPF
jgi:hypothetical protein